MRQENFCQFILPPLVEATPSAAPTSVTHRLTKKEAEVVALVSQGKTNKETARELGGMSPHTVATHLRRAYVKLGINRRDQLADLLESAG